MIRVFLPVSDRSPPDANTGGKEADPDSFSSMDWLEDEAAHLERSLLRDYARLAQVRLEMQVFPCFHRADSLCGTPSSNLPACALYSSSK